MSLALLRDEPALRRLWVADAVVDLGEGLQGIALPWLVLVTTGDPLQLGLALALRTTPDIVVAPAIGYLTDAVARRRVMFGALAVEAGVLAVVPATAAFGELSVGVVYGVLIALSVSYAAYNTAREAALPAVVGDARLDGANALFHGATDALSIGFLLVGGVLTDLLGAVPTTAVAAGVVATATVPVLGLPRLAPPGRPADASTRAAGLIASFRRGVRAVEGTVVRDVLLVGALINVAVVPYAVLSGSIARTVLGASLGWAGLQAGFRTGSLVANGAVPKVPLTRRRTFLVGIGGVAAGAIAIAAFGPALAARSPPVAAVGLGALFFGFGAAQPFHNVPGDSLVQSAVEGDTRGQVVALSNAGVQLGFPIGYLGAGALAARHSPFDVFWLAGFLAAGVTLLAAVRLPGSG